MRLNRFLRQQSVLFRRSDHGVTLVEFALVAPIFIAILVAILELAVDAYTARAIDHATLQAAAVIQSGQPQIQNMDAATFKSQVLCPMLPALVTCSNVIMNLRINTNNGGDSALQLIWYWTPPSALDANNQVWCLAPAEGPQLLQVAYRFPLLDPIWAAMRLSTTSGQYHISQAAFYETAYGQMFTPPSGC